LRFRAVPDTIVENFLITHEGFAPMSIAVNCPMCGKAYNLNENLVGKKVRCKQCADAFLVEGDAPSVEPTAAEATGFKSEPGPRPAVEVALATDDDLPAVEVVAAGEKEAPKSKRGLIILGVGGGALAAVVCVVLLVCAGVLGGAYFLGRKIRTSAEESASNRPQGSGGPFTPVPKTVRDAIADLQSADPNRKRQGADWLAKTPVNAAEQPQVARALEPLLNDFDPSVKSAAANALATWATVENVPALVRCVESNDRQASDAATRALVRLKDQRAAAALAAQLPDWGRRNTAAAALQSIGRACEGEVVKYAFHPDQGTRDQALRLLRGYGTKDDVILTQATVELKSNDVNRRNSAAAWLATAPVDAGQREKVAVALNAPLRDGNDNVRQNAIKAARVWATATNVPTLVEAVQDPGWAHPFAPRDLRIMLIAMLGDLKDVRAAAALAKDLSTDYHPQARAALEQLGKPAELEVLKYYNHPDAATRQRVADLLKKYGTADEARYQQTMTDLKSAEAGRKAAAGETLAVLPADEKRRAEVSAALEPLLTDKDGKVVAGAAKAAKVWGTKDNVPSLLKIVNDTARPFTWGEHTWSAMEALIALKDERGYWAIAQWVGHPFEAERGKKYLMMIGAAAEPEVAKHLADPDANARRAAWKALGVVGIKSNAQTYQALALQEKDGFAKNIAQEALRAIAARP
jgi:HEAT repeat protein